MKFQHRLFLVGAWLIFTLSLAAWWLIFGLNQVDQLTELLRKSGEQIGDSIYRQHKMLLWEGGILLFTLLIGGVSLFYLVWKTQKQSLKLKEFFATFSHDLKTSLASMRIQAESLQEDFKGQDNPLFNRLVSDTVRLEVQLENSLFLADAETERLFLEDVDVSQLISTLGQNWPEVGFEVKSPFFVKADKRALESVLKNIFQNAVIHGKASSISVVAHDSGSSRVKIEIKDNGNGFKGEAQNLGELFQRQTPTSGSGVGLYLVKSLFSKMNGQARFENEPDGFKVELEISGGLHS